MPKRPVDIFRSTMPLIDRKGNFAFQRMDLSLKKIHGLRQALRYFFFDLSALFFMGLRPHLFKSVIYRLFEECLLNSVI